MKKLIIIGDTHCDLGILERVIQKEDEAIAVLHCGDLGVYDNVSMGRLSARERYLIEKHGNDISAFQPYLDGRQKTGLPVFLIPGNHEDHALYKELEAAGGMDNGITMMTPGKAYRVGCGNVTFEFMGLGHILPERLGEKRRSELKYIQESDLAEFVETGKRQKPDILLFHDAPFLKSDPEDRGIGSSRITRAIKEIGASKAFCGHMHFEYETWIGHTDVFGCGYGRLGRYCLLAEDGDVEWKSLDQSQIKLKKFLSEKELELAIRDRHLKDELERVRTKKFVPLIPGQEVCRRFFDKDSSDLTVIEQKKVQAFFRELKLLQLQDRLKSKEEAWLFAEAFFRIRTVDSNHF